MSRNLRLVKREYDHLAVLGEPILPKQPGEFDQFDAAAHKGIGYRSAGKMLADLLKSGRIVRRPGLVRGRWGYLYREAKKGKK